MREIVVDMTGEQWADNGETTYFGGTIKVGEKELTCYGNDRGDSHDGDMFEALVEQLGLPDPLPELMEDQINDCITDMTCSGLKWKVTLDALELKWEQMPHVRSEEEIRERLKTWEEMEDFDPDIQDEVVRVLKWVLGE